MRLRTLMSGQIPALHFAVPAKTELLEKIPVFVRCGVNSLAVFGQLRLDLMSGECGKNRINTLRVAEVFAGILPLESFNCLLVHGVRKHIQGRDTEVLEKLLFVRTGTSNESLECSNLPF